MDRLTCAINRRRQRSIEPQTYCLTRRWLNPGGIDKF
nr:MAG TPA: hypothetical protein [Caudoviricetes sp.]